MLTLALDLTATRRALAGLPAALDRQRPQLLAAIGRAVRQHVFTDFVVKSRGGAGSDGVTWKPLAAATLQRKQRRGRPQIGIGTGQLGALGNIAVELVADAVAVRFLDEPNATYFNADRPLIPETMPTSWYQECDQLAARAVAALTAPLFSESA